VITRALGTEPDVDVDTFSVEAETGDVYLLCSDGLTDMLSDGEILAVLERTDDLDAAARALVEAANAHGGDDNITVVVFEIADEAAAAAALEETQRLPASEAPQAAADDEDTLSGLDPVPAVDTAVISAEDVRRQLEEQAHDGDRAEGRPAPARAPRARRERAPARGADRSLLPFLVLLLAVAAIALLVLWGLFR